MPTHSMAPGKTGHFRKTGIRYAGKPLGRPPPGQVAEQKAAQRKREKQQKQAWPQPQYPSCGDGPHFRSLDSQHFPGHKPVVDASLAFSCA